MKIIWKFTLLLVIALTLAACGGTAAVSSSKPYPAEGQPTIELAATSVTSADTAYPANARPTPRGALEASDPAAFQMASGGLQLVEFFAFW